MKKFIKNTLFAILAIAAIAAINALIVAAIWAAYTPGILY